LSKKRTKKPIPVATPPKSRTGLSETLPLRHCVMCGSNRVTRKHITVQLRDGREVREIEADVCPACGEQYFDLEAMRKLDAAP